MSHSQAAAAYRGLVRKIGMGFHPDTRGDEYMALPENITPALVDKIIQDAIDEGIDVYEMAYGIFESWGCTRAK